MSKTDNYNLSSKLALRRYFLSKYHGDGGARVIDCCAGSGKIWKTLRDEFELKRYLPIDLKAEKGRLKLDSVRLLGVSPLPYNVVDIDTYGSPWKHWSSMVPGVEEPTTVFLTIGMTFMVGHGTLSKEAKRVMGLDGIKTKFPPCMLGRFSGQSVQYSIAAAMDRLKIVESIEAFPSWHARYIGLRLEPR